jgi:shikimate kinase/chorismate mutase
MTLQNYRLELDRLDAEMTRLFAERMTLIEKIGAWKQERGLPVLDAAREREKLATVRSALPEELGGYGEALYSRILSLSRVRQRLLLGENIILIGMPGCGKTTVGRALGELLCREMLDSDEWIERREGKTIPEIFASCGEETFRALETAALTQLCAHRGCVIATGGGCVTRKENYTLLRRSGCVVWLRRESDALETKGRPLSLGQDVRELYRKRKPLYERFADVSADNCAGVWDAALHIIDLL